MTFKDPFSEAAEEVFDLSERGEFQPPCWNPL
jgi:hypothetical protein